MSMPLKTSSNISNLRLAYIARAKACVQVQLWRLDSEKIVNVVDLRYVVFALRSNLSLRCQQHVSHH